MVRVERDEDFSRNDVPRLNEFWHKHILTEIITRSGRNNCKYGHNRSDLDTSAKFGIHIHFGSYVRYRTLAT